jgi:spore germination protein GerM
VRRLAAALALVVALGACGITEDDVPRTMARENVPFQLLSPATSTTTTVVDEGSMTAIGIYLVTPDGALVARSRTTRGAPTVEKAIRALLGGPTAEEQAANLTSQISSDTRLLGVEGPFDGVVTVDLSSEFLAFTGPSQVQAIAQVVFTAVDVPGIQSVLFRFDGERREVPAGDGELTAEPLNRSDYRLMRR